MKMKTLTEKRFFEWQEDEISVTLRNKSGSYGGGQRYSLFVSGADMYNQILTGEKTMTLNAARPDIHKIPCVILEE